MIDWDYSESQNTGMNQIEQPARKGRWKNHPLPVVKTCAVCGKAFMVRAARAATAKYCAYRCHQIGEGRKGGTVRGEQIKKLDRGLAYAKTKGRHTHRIVAETKLGRPLNVKEVVHHKDGNIRNNSPENLAVLPSQAEHARLHAPQMLKVRKEKHGY